MPTTSLLTIVKGRRYHLDNLLRGVARSHQKPDEVIIVFMNEAVPDGLLNPGCSLRAVALFDANHALPLAAARNRAASLATGQILLFLDVDCVAAPDYVSDLTAAVVDTDALVMGDVRYLPARLPDDWDYEWLDRSARHHPRRPRIPAGATEQTDAYHLFWSLTFGIRRAHFDRIGGFDESYRCYGGEDTDFAFTARKLGIPFYLTAARCYHQHHATCTPPYNNLPDIVTNARVFYRKWGRWPMEGWLKAFAESGHVRWGAHELVIERLPTDEEIARHRSEDPFA